MLKFTVVNIVFILCDLLEVFAIKYFRIDSIQPSMVPEVLDLRVFFYTIEALSIEVTIGDVKLWFFGLSW